MDRGWGDRWIESGVIGGWRVGDRWMENGVVSGQVMHFQIEKFLK